MILWELLAIDILILMLLSIISRVSATLANCIDSSGYYLSSSRRLLPIISMISPIVLTAIGDTIDSIYRFGYYRSSVIAIGAVNAMDDFDNTTDTS